MITLHVLGALDLQAAEGRHIGSPVSGSKRLGLLAYLAVDGRRGFPHRETLLGLFWPELDQQRARNSLSNMLHQIRRSLGRGALAVKGDQVGLSEDVVWSDARAFEEALGAGRLAEALELYRGDLLEGFFVPGASAEFDHWLDAERARLRRRAVEAARELIDEAEQAGITADAVRWARKAYALDPFDELAARRLILLLGSAGDHAGALRVHDDFAKRLAREFGAEPSAETRAAVETVRARSLEGAAPPHPPSPGRAAQPDSMAARSPRSLAGRDAGIRRQTAAVSEEPSARSIAVLPFENLSGATDTEAFALGLHDDLLTELSSISALNVIARTSVRRYRGTEKSIQEIARELGVGTVVEVGVQTAAGRLRLNVQVIDGVSGSHRWAERYDRELTVGKLFDLQSDLAEEIARAVRARLTPSERGRSVREPTESMDAYRVYSHGRALLDQRTETGMRRALDYFERAVELDPGYALAWAGLGDGLALLADYGFEPADRVLPRAEHAARHALELDPGLAEGYASLGECHVVQRNGPAAIAALRRAINVRPGYAEAHNWLSWMSQVLGDATIALRSAERAVEFDPLSPEAVSNLSLSHLANGDAETALREARRVRELQPDWTTGPFFEGLALFHLGRFDDAVTLLTDLTVEWAGAGPQLTVALADAEAGSGSRARALLAEFERAGDSFSAGMVHLAFGDHDKGFAAIRSVSDWSYWPTLSFHHFYPDILAPLRASPLYERVRRDVDRAWGT